MRLFQRQVATIEVLDWGVRDKDGGARKVADLLRDGWRTEAIVSGSDGKRAVVFLVRRKWFWQADPLFSVRNRVIEAPAEAVA